AAIAITDPEIDYAAVEVTGALAFENNASISAAYAGIFDTGLRSFLNRGSVTTLAGAYSREASTVGEAFHFTNSGTMTASDGTAVALYVHALSGSGVGAEAVALDFTNSGKINAAGEGRDAVQAFSDGGVMK